MSALLKKDISVTADIRLYNTPEAKLSDRYVLKAVVTPDNKVEVHRGIDTVVQVTDLAEFVVALKAFGDALDLEATT